MNDEIDSFEIERILINQLAKEINDALIYMVGKSLKDEDGEDINWVVNNPTSYYKVIDIFYNYAQDNTKEIDAIELLNLVIRLGILKEVEFQKYAFTDENFFHIYYYYYIMQSSNDQ